MKKILVVDDDRTTRHLIALQLRRAGYTVAEAGDGARRSSRVRGRALDLVLLDVWMPGMDGLEVLGRIFASEPSQPRVVVMTADDTSDTLLRAIREHAYRYVTKPVEPKAAPRARSRRCSASKPEAAAHRGRLGATRLGGAARAL